MRFIVRLGPYKLVPATDILRESSSLRSTCASAGTFAVFVLQPLIDCARGLTAQARRGVPSVLPTHAGPSAVPSGSARTAVSSGGRTLGGGAGPASAAGAAAAARFAALAAAPRGSGVDASGAAAAQASPPAAALDPASGLGSAAGGDCGVLGSASDALARASGLTPDTRYARLKNEVDEDAAAAGV